MYDGWFMLLSRHEPPIIHTTDLLQICSSAAMVAPLASSGLARCEVVLHCNGTIPLEGGGV